MIRTFHRWPGLVALALLTLLALTGAALSVFPAAQSWSSPQADRALTVAELVPRILAVYPAVEQIRRAPSGRITAYWLEGGAPGSAVIDPATGRGVGPADPNRAERWLTDLHRSLFLGDGGRIVTAIGSAAMVIMCISGAALVARRVGGWRRWFVRLRGPLAGRLHVEFARAVVVGLALSSVTSLWMTASVFGFLPDHGISAPFPQNVSGQTGVAIGKMDLLATTPVSALREFNFPYAGDETDVFTLKTDNGTAYLDQGTGALLSSTQLTFMARVTEIIYLLHTGQGASVLGLLLGLMALGVPVMGVTGVIVWRAGARGRPRIKGNHPAAQSETIILVGSEGGSTWGFAATLHRALSEAGQTVHTAKMSGFDPARYHRARRILVLSATYGDGDAPASAKGFRDRLARAEPKSGVSLAVLGFGDSSFPAFCAYAASASEAVAEKGWALILPFGTIDRQSPQAFARWGRELGAAMGIDLVLAHEPVLPATKVLTLMSRRDYGQEVQAPTAILRFALPKLSLWHRVTRQGFGHFHPGDLLGIIPAGSAVPRFYSLASGSRDGFVEVVVRKHPGGLCSGQLLSLAVGGRVTAFLRSNPGFRTGRSAAPLILIGAGTGIGPLAGFVRGNKTRRPVHLFFGMRHPDSDFLYAPELSAWQTEGHLQRLVTAVSRTERPAYVQDELRGDSARITRLIRDGARVMVCGGRDMAAGVADVMAEILAPSGLTPARLKAEGRYVEDVY